jgi:hypothetical protein
MSSVTICGQCGDLFTFDHVCLDDSNTHLLWDGDPQTIEMTKPPRHMPHLPNVEYYRRSIHGTMIEAKDVIASWGLTYHLGTALAYILRAGKKDGNTAQGDIAKAKDHLAFELDRLKDEGSR